MVQLFVVHFNITAARKRNYKKPIHLFFIALTRHQTEISLIVSKSKFWDAPTICDEIIDRKAQATISARKLYKLACETEIRLAIAQIIPIFKDAVRLKWQKIFSKAPGDKTTPKNPWEIL